MNKKGMIGESFSMLIATIIIILVLLVFFAAFKFLTFKFMTPELNRVSLENQETIVLENYLRSNYAAAEGDISVADLIRLSPIDVKYKEDLKSATEAFFSGYKDFEIDIPSIEFNYKESSTVYTPPYTADQYTLATAPKALEYKSFIIITLPPKQTAVYLYKK